MSGAATDKVSRAVWIGYAVGAFAYIVAVFNRTSFGVAAIPAAERFSASASDISMFTVVQLVVYAGLQIPVGVMVDRYGPRRLVIFGTLMMAAGQALLAVAPSISIALIARVMIGGGDAFIFNCVLRRVAESFPARSVPMMTQVTGLLGQLGALASAVPFAALLQVQSWTVSFMVVAAHGVLASVLAMAFLRASEPGSRGRQVPLRDIGRQLASAWRHPGTRLGFWTHFATPFSVTVFGLLWGYPYLTAGLGYSQQTASLMLSISVVVAIIAATPLGRFVSRHPLRRSTMVLALVALCAFAWTIVLLWPGDIPPWVIAVMLVLISLGGPGSMVGFDFARTFNPTSRLGSATGIVNVGGFGAALVCMFAMGAILDWVDGPHTGSYSRNAFEWAFAFQYVLWALGVVMIVRWRNRTRRVLATEDGVVVPPLRSALRRDWARYRRQRARERYRRRHPRPQPAGESRTERRSPTDQHTDDPMEWEI